MTYRYSAEDSLTVLNLFTPIRAQFGQISLRQAVMGNWPVFVRLFPVQYQKMRDFNPGPFHLSRPTEHCLVCSEVCSRPEPWMRLACFLHDVGKAETRTEDETGIHYYGHDTIGAEIGEEWLDSFDTNWDKLGIPVKLVCGLIREHMFDQNGVGPGWMDRIIRKYGDTEEPKEAPGEILPAGLGDLRRADWLASRWEAKDIHQIDQLQQAISDHIGGRQADRRRAHEMLAAGKVPHLKHLAVTGQDLLELGMKSGPSLGQMLKWLQTLVNDGQTANERQALLAKVRLAHEQQARSKEQA